MREESPETELRCKERRRFLQALAGAGTAAAAVAAVAAVASLAACREDPKRPAGVEIPLSKLPEGVRVVLPVGSQPVEFRRTGSAVTALSLACTHQGCEVLWVEEENGYRCPCHAGTYDALGNVLGGPPPAPLRTIPAEVRGNVVFAHL